MTATIRLATEADAEGIVAIYAPIVRETAISFEVEAPDVNAMRRRIAEALGHWPWLICERRGEVLGYAYASTHRTRAAYQWSVDVSVYVHARIRRSGWERPSIPRCCGSWTSRVSTTSTPASRSPTPPASAYTSRWNFNLSVCIARSATNSARGTTWGGGIWRCAHTPSLPALLSTSDRFKTLPNLTPRWQRG